ncbi:hypothetical protein K490DRAFT_65983 [Saccharata proteae CBS 121410]|uniref:Pathway-specific nitrogen regulator n=1 Tax=Saccharata proteae CBS 121410 TaxID=1314787 RepID=A0A9P4LZP1_9PEZI|nr:hypothetical protein K490DRAFT_65983 [Saccharata proteae CBS 121410]
MAAFHLSRDSSFHSSNLSKNRYSISTASLSEDDAATSPTWNDDEGAPEDIMSLSTSRDASFTADVLPSPDVVVSSIEPHIRTSPISPTLSSSNYTRYTRRSSAISDLPSETSSLNGATREPSPFSPMKHRPPFHTANSVKAMQMASPSISSYDGYTSPSKKHKQERRSYGLSTPTKSSGGVEMLQSPRESSAKRSSRRGSPAPDMLAQMPPSKLSSRNASTDAKEQYPLVLLHVTLLPVCPPYVASVMEAVLPAHVLENYRLLEDKMADSLLMQRGILIPHPREEYELLEERLLESLDLKSPRILKCGHFYVEDEKGSVCDRHHRAEERRESGSQMETYSEQSTVVDAVGDYEDDADLCDECFQPMKHDAMGAGSGTKRWDIKIYAANGLMRAGAWSAAWTEMERVDVEITPWISEDLRRAMERRRAEEENEERDKLIEAEEMRNNELREAEETRQKELREAEEIRQKELREAEERARAEAQAAAEKQIREAEEAAKMEKYEREARAEVEKLRMIGAAALAADAERKKAKDTLQETLEKERRSLESRIDGEIQRQQNRVSKPPAQIPLTVLLRNYFYLLAKDRRNWALVILSLMVVYLALRPQTQYMEPEYGLGLDSPVADMSAQYEGPDARVAETMISFGTLIGTQVNTTTNDESNTVKATDPASKNDIKEAAKDVPVENERTQGPMASHSTGGLSNNSTLPMIEVVLPLIDSGIENDAALPSHPTQPTVEAEAETRVDPDVEEMHIDAGFPDTPPDTEAFAESMAANSDRMTKDQISYDDSEEATDHIINGQEELEAGSDTGAVDIIPNMIDATEEMLEEGLTATDE